MSRSPASHRQVIRAFWEGATRPGATALAGVLLVASLWLAAGAFVFKPERFRDTAPRRWMRDGRDDIGRLTVLSWQARLAPPANPAVYFIGASALREALVDESFFEERLRAPDQGKVTVRVLIADGMTMEEKAATLNQLGENFPGLAVIEVGPQNLSRGVARSHRFAGQLRLGFRSPIYEEECRRMGAVPRLATGIYFLDNLRFLLTRTAALKNLARVPPEYNWHRFDQMKPLSPADLERRMIPLDKESLERNAGILRRMARRLRDHGRTRLVLLEVPWQDQVDAANQPPRRAQELADYHHFMTALARELGAAYVNPTAAAGLSPGDFVDYNHLGNPAARRRYSEAVAASLQTLLAQTVLP